jgi:molybdenum cofactor cytidylyltransferase
MTDTGIIILAAGNSSRLGRPKQLLPYRGKTLLMHVVTESMAASLRPVVVVTGAYHEEVQDALPVRQVFVVHNPQWESGMASGIVAGLAKALTVQADLQAVIIAVCDQPHISAELLLSLMKKRVLSANGLIASEYAGTRGTPVLFDRVYFEELVGLSGNAGAKQLLKLHPDDVATVSFPKGYIDIDTEEDLHRCDR